MSCPGRQRTDTGRAGNPDTYKDGEPPANNPQFTETWFLRCQELMDKYQPDLVYFDDTELPLGQTGLDIAAHYCRGGFHGIVFGPVEQPIRQE